MFFRLKGVIRSLRFNVFFDNKVNKLYIKNKYLLFIKVLFISVFIN